MTPLRPILTVCAIVLAAATAIPATPVAAQAPSSVAGSSPAPSRARISEVVTEIPTYPFSEPNPIPMLARDTRLYPYHSFDGYAEASEPREWKVVRLENDYVEVFVLPQVGGKVWGAVVKKTGHEFIYRNEVLKFRNIALRGPWTSGGVEFNFGVIGHTPATATPVDYLLRENDDGSVSCFVGAMDLPSRTTWRVEIRLDRDKAYFETRALWYNPTPLAQPYYNWMTGAAAARSDLEMTIPGDAYLEHSGRVRDWPEDGAGRYLPRYANNDFGDNKSYHVVGELNDFFGGYYAEADWGFGHWANYEDLPGQKLWLWALSRAGGIWEDLLTDTDGQYVEFQAGRLLVQYQPGADANPITQASFDPMSESRWSETWFPVEGIGGLTDASRVGALHVSREGGELSVSLSSFVAVTDTLRVWADGRLLAAEPFEAEPLGRYEKTVAVGDAERVRVTANALDLEYDSDPSDRRLARPFETPEVLTASIPDVERDAFEARELLEARRYPEARALFARVRATAPWNRAASLGLAELEVRSARYEPALEHVNRALSRDAYDAEANFLAGVAYRALGRQADARDAFGWAVRSTAYRSAGYVELAELAILRGALGEAERYGRLAVDFDRHGIAAWRVLAVAGRLAGNRALAEEARAELFAVDPLHHFALAEAFLAAPSEETARDLSDRLGGEFPEQTVLEIAVKYASLGLTDDALDILDRFGGQGALASAWRAYLRQDSTPLGAAVDPAFVFPYRPETLPVLAWAAENGTGWIWRYLYALELWALDRTDEAADAMDRLRGEPDYGPAYAARAALLSSERGTDPSADLARAVDLAPGERALHVARVRALEDAERWDEAVRVVGEARAGFPGDFNLKLLQASALLHVGRADDAVTLFDDIHVLPSENARDSHALYAAAHTMVALDMLEAGDPAAAQAHLEAAREWPERLGQGMPYEPEERLQLFVLAMVDRARGRSDAAADHMRAVADATGRVDPSTASALDLLAAPERFQPTTADADPRFDTLEGGMVRRALTLYRRIR